METSLVFHSHPPEVAWEDYAFGRLSEKRIPPLEEHLLACELCQTSLEEVTEYIRLMKAGLMQAKLVKVGLVTGGTADLPLASPDGLARVWQFISPAVERPRGLMWATALAASCMGLWIAVRAAPSLETGELVAQVTLDSFRDISSTVHAAARKPLDLRILTTDVPDAAEYRLEVVTASGKQVWSGAPDVSSGTLSVRLPGRAAGLYWVRLYTRQSEILREFGLLLE